jgi:hypothetical protein
MRVHVSWHDTTFTGVQKIIQEADSVSFVRKTKVPCLDFQKTRYASLFSPNPCFASSNKHVYMRYYYTRTLVSAVESKSFHPDAQ